MKRRFTILTAALALLAFLAIPMGMMGQTRSEEVYSTCLFGSDYNNLSVGSYTATWTATNGDYTWTIVNGNNNNNAWSYVKFGRKNNESVGKITTTEAYEQAITKVDLTIDAITAGSVNSIKLYASTDNDTWTEVGSFAKSTGLQTVTVVSPAADQYYMIEFDCASGSANGLVTVSKVEYYYNTSGANSPTISADNVELAYDATSGAIEYTVNNPVQGGELTASTNAEWITIGTVGETVPFTCTVNEGSIRTATVTLTYSYGNDNVTKDITITQAANPNGPGSQNNPYTVAQARAAIDANAGTQGVYATGIVSDIPTAWSTEHNNITFNFVDNEGDNNFLQAYRCVSSTDVDASTVAVGDVVVVYGNLTKYGSTYEFGQGCQLVSLTHPVITTPVVTVTPNTISAPAEGVDGTLTITYENITEIISFDYYFCDANGGELEGNDPDWIYAEINEPGEEENYTLSYIIDANDGVARTAYIKVYTLDDNLEEVYAIVTVNQAQYVVDYAELPFEYDGNGTGDLPNGFTVSGLGTYNSSPAMKFDGTGDYAILKFNERPGTLTFDIKGNAFSGGTFTVQTSEDGVTYTDLETYTELGDTQHESFDNLGENVRYIKWIYTEKVSGNVGLGNIALAEYVAPVLVASITVNPDEVNVDAAEHDGTLDLTYENLTITEMSDFDIQFCDANGDELSEEPDWIEVLVAEQDPEIGEGYVVSYYMVENEGTDARTAYFKVYAMDDETNLVYSNLVTINQDAYVENITYTLTTTIESGRHYIIVGYKNNDAYAMGAQGNNNRSAESITLTNTGASVDLEVVSEFIINGPDADGNYTIYDAAVPGYLFAASSNSNYLRTKEFVDANGKWAITFNEENNAANIVAQGSNTRNVMRYNPNNNIFACYASGQNDVYLYVRDEEENYEFVTDITGYSTVENTAGGYYLIASPVNNVNPATVNGMLDNDYDLYYFNQSATNEEWQNYKANPFSLESGKGYLYANSETFTMHFTGTPQTPNESYVQLAYDANSEFAGMNLVGNPWGYAVSIDRPFYTLNDEGSEVVPSEVEAINPMQGVFVEAETDGETMYFTPYVPSSSSKLVLNVNKNRGALVDRTIISFDNNGRLPKFMINPDNTKIYIPQDNAEFAVVQSDDIEAEMPVNFKVNENGFYMINVDVKNMDLDYLHLIDHKTGNDVDLLATPNYGFNANISDYEARFSLVYRTFTGVNENNSETFAYFNGSEWVINNGENATVQVIDMLGRIVMSANNANSISTATMAPGTYVLRLTNGSEVMTQKIVVE